MTENNAGGTNWQAPTSAPEQAPTQAWSSDAPAQPAGVPTAAAPAANAWRPGIIPLRPQNFGELLNATFKAIRFNPAVVVGLPALVLIVAQVFVSAGMWNIYGDPSLYDPYATEPGFVQEGQLAATLLGLLVASLVFGLASIICAAFVAVACSRAVLGEKISAGDAWRAVRGRIVPLVLYSLLLGIAATIVFGVLIAIGVAAALEPAFLVLYMILVIVGSMVLGLFLMVKLALPTTVIAIEGVNAVDGLKRGWQLTAGRFWPLLGLILVATLIVNVISQVFGFPLGLVGGIAALAWPSAASVVMNLVYGLSMYLGGLLSISFLSSVYAMVYVDQRMRLEGFDLQLIEAAQARA